MKYLVLFTVLLTSCSTVKGARGCPELNSKSSCMAAGRAERP